MKNVFVLLVVVIVGIIVGGVLFFLKCLIILIGIGNDNNVSK